MDIDIIKTQNGTGDWWTKVKNLNILYEREKCSYIQS